MPSVDYLLILVGHVLRTVDILSSATDTLCILLLELLSTIDQLCTGVEGHDLKTTDGLNRLKEATSELALQWPALSTVVRKIEQIFDLSRV